MQTKFDIGEIAYIPVCIRKITIEESDTISCSTILTVRTVRVCPLEQTSSPPRLNMTCLETDLFSKEDIVNGEAEDKLNANKV